MEKLQNNTPSKLVGKRILNLIEITSDNEQDLADDAMNKDGIMNEFVFGDGLSVADSMIVNGRNVLEEIPRPDQFGNNRLGLMAVLDTMSSAAKFTLTVEEVDTLNVAAD